MYYLIRVLIFVIKMNRKQQKNKSSPQKIKKQPKR